MRKVCNKYSVVISLLLQYAPTDDLGMKEGTSLRQKKRERKNLVRLVLLITPFCVIVAHFVHEKKKIQEYPILRTCCVLSA